MPPGRVRAFALSAVAIGTLIAATSAVFALEPEKGSKLASLPARVREALAESNRILAAARGAATATKALPAPAPASAPTSEATRRLVDDLTGARFDLIRYVSAALERNLGLRMVKTGEAAARARVLEARTPYRAKVDGSTTDTRLNEPQSFNIPGRGTSVLSDNVQFAYHVGVSQVLYSFGKFENALTAAEEGQIASRYEIEFQAGELVHRARKTYRDLALTDSLRAIAEASLRNAEAHLATVRDQYEAGLASRFEVLRAEVQVENGKPPLLSARNAVQRAREGFNLVIHRNLSSEVILTEAGPVADDAAIAGSGRNRSRAPATARNASEIPLDEAIASGLRFRADLARAAHEHRSAVATLAAIRASNHPTLAAVSNYDRAVGRRNPVDEFDESWNVSLALQAPLYDQGVRDARAEGLKADIARRALLLEDLKTRIELEVRAAHGAEAEARERIAVTEKTVEDAIETLSLVRATYKEGLATSIEVLDAQLALDRARNDRTRALHDAAVSRSDLERAMGVAAAGI